MKLPRVVQPGLGSVGRPQGALEGPQGTVGPQAGQPGTVSVRKPVHYPGKKFGHLTLIQRVPNPRPKRGKNGKLQKVPQSKRSRWVVECVCGKRETVPIHYLTRRQDPKTSCGCVNKTIKTIHNREYRIWCMMRQRCYFPTHVSYKNYGGRGIRIADEWLGENGFEAFFNHIGPAPSLAHSIDRIDNDKNYQPGNVRWATALEQAKNKRSTTK